MKSLTRYSVVLLGAEYLLLGTFSLFMLVRPDFESVVASVPTQEILWAAVNVPKPSSTSTEVAAPTQMVSEPTLDATSPTQIPDLAVDIVDDNSLNSSNPHEETQGPDDGRWIDVNLSEQQIYAYEGNVLVNSFIVSTGLPDTPTVTGEYRIYVKVPMQDMSGPGYYLSDVPWVMFFYDEYGFHGTYWHNNFGTPMSRGCVNLTVDDAKWLYDWASVGTRVSVHY